MNKFLLASLGLLLSISSFAQFNKSLKRIETSNTAESKLTFKPAEFPGGIEKFYKYLSKKMKVPKDAKKQKVKGKVMIAFVIDTLGNVKKESVKVTQPLLESCDKEAIRLVKNSPAWIPAVDLRTNKKIESQYSLPIIFHTKD